MLKGRFRLFTLPARRAGSKVILFNPVSGVTDAAAVRFGGGDGETVENLDPRTGVVVQH
jgi:hypothetical protein